ncbi:unnamed protein product [Symbiodinium necroappetens]|uniref:DAAF9 N-terminal domain-containing protein n=1 Tax=Symbiodinium necroappetens TaxID=1628268 RepID=A0A813CNJ5_9DINO|nr:unnamed protein product [Symbiodinium necroappetens]
MAASQPSSTKRLADRPVWLKSVDLTGYSALACRARWIQLQILRKSRGLAAVIIGSGPDVSFNGANEVALSWLLLGISGRELLASTVDTVYSECFVCIRADRTYIFCKRSVQQEVVMRTALWEAVTIIVPSEEDEADADKYEALKIGAFIDMVKSCSSLGVFVRELDTGHDLKMTVERWPLVQAFGFDDYGHGFLTLRRQVVNLEADFQQKILAAWDLQSMLWARSLVSKLQKAWEDALLCYDSHAGKDFLVNPAGQTGAPALQLNPAPRVLFGVESDKIVLGIIPTGDEPPQHFAPDAQHMIWEGVDPVTGIAATRTYLLNTPFEKAITMAMQTGPPYVPSGLQLRQSPVLSSRRHCVFQACGHLRPAFIAVGVGAVSSRRRLPDTRRQQTKVRAEESGSESVPTQLIPDEFFDEPQVDTFQSCLMQCQALRRKVQEELAYELEDDVWESLKARSLTKPLKASGQAQQEVAPTPLQSGLTTPQEAGLASQPAPPQGASEEGPSLLQPFSFEDSTAVGLTAASHGVDINDQTAMKNWLAKPVQNNQQVFEMVRSYHRAITRPEMYKFGFATGSGLEDRGRNGVEGFDLWVAEFYEAGPVHQRAHPGLHGKVWWQLRDATVF